MTRCEQCGSKVKKLYDMYGTKLCEFCQSNYYHEKPEGWDDDFI